MKMSGELHASAALPLERASGTHWTEDWVGFRGSLDAVVRRKVPALAGNRIPVVQPVAYSLY